MSRTRTKHRVNPETVAAEWNDAHPIGARVRYRSSPGSTTLETTTTSAAYVLSGHTAVVFVDGVSGCVALFALEPVTEP